jgi:hypothetical protein
VSPASKLTPVCRIFLSVSCPVSLSCPCCPVPRSCLLYAAYFAQFPFLPRTPYSSKIVYSYAIAFQRYMYGVNLLIQYSSPPTGVPLQALYKVHTRNRTAATPTRHHVQVLRIRSLIRLQTPRHALHTLTYFAPSLQTSRAPSRQFTLPPSILIARSAVHLFTSPAPTHPAATFHPSIQPSILLPSTD